MSNLAHDYLNDPSFPFFTLEKDYQLTPPVLLYMLPVCLYHLVSDTF